MLWLTLPQIQGSTYLYVTYVHPFLLEHELQIDTWLVEMKEKCREAGTVCFYQLVDKLKDVLLRALNTPENALHGVNGMEQSQAENVPERHLDAASAYAVNWIRQFGPTASAIFQPMHNRMPDSFQLRPPNYTSSLDAQRLFTTSNSSDHIFRTEPDGYRIPDYDEIQVTSVPHASHDRSMSSRRPFVSQNLSSDSAPNGQPGSVLSYRSNNLNLSGYDEIGRDEASGSENDSLLLRKPAPRTGSSSASNQRPRLSDGNQFSPSSNYIDQPGKRTISSGSRWFNWASKSNLDDMDSKKQN